MQVNILIQKKEKVLTAKKHHRYVDYFLTIGVYRMFCCGEVACECEREQWWVGGSGSSWQMECSLLSLPASEPCPSGHEHTGLSLLLPRFLISTAAGQKRGLLGPISAEVPNHQYRNCIEYPLYVRVGIVTRSLPLQASWWLCLFLNAFSCKAALLLLPYHTTQSRWLWVPSCSLSL